MEIEKVEIQQEEAMGQKDEGEDKEETKLQPECKKYKWKDKTSMKGKVGKIPMDTHSNDQSNFCDDIDDNNLIIAGETKKEEDPVILPGQVV